MTWSSQSRITRTVVSLPVSGGSWWNWPEGLRNFISDWKYGIGALAVFI